MELETEARVPLGLVFQQVLPSAWLQLQLTLQFDSRLSCPCCLPSGPCLICVLCEGSRGGYNLSSKSVGGPCGRKFQLELFSSVERRLESFLGPLLLG